MVVASSCTGQGALQQLPSKSQTTKRTVSSYVLPDQLIHERVGLKGDQAGLPVLKVTKVRPSERYSIFSYLLVFVNDHLRVCCF